MTTTDTYSEQSMTVPLPVGARVTLLKDVDIEDEGTGYSAQPFFEDYVEQYVEETGLLQFRESGIGYGEFQELLDEANGIEILMEG